MDIDGHFSAIGSENSFIYLNHSIGHRTCFTCGNIVYGCGINCGFSNGNANWIPKKNEPEKKDGGKVTWRSILSAQWAALKKLENEITEEQVNRAVELLRGRPIVITGVGKSFIAAQKIAATMASLKLNARALSAGEAAHGDAGAIPSNSTLILISQSGETKEVIAMTGGNYYKTIGICKAGSTLASKVQLIFNSSVDPAGEYRGIVPIASFHVQVAIGEAIAIALAEGQGFRFQDLAQSHPGGSIGTALTKMVKNVMSNVPVHSWNCAMHERIDFILEDMKRGIVGFNSSEEKLIGCITDGDIRRSGNKTLLAEIIQSNPKTVSPDSTVAEALDLMEHHKITALFVVDGEMRPLGIVYLHDLLRF